MIFRSMGEIQQFSLRPYMYRKTLNEGCHKRQRTVFRVYSYYSRNLFLRNEFILSLYLTNRFKYSVYFVILNKIEQINCSFTKFFIRFQVRYNFYNYIFHNRMRNHSTLFWKLIIDIDYQSRRLFSIISFYFFFYIRKAMEEVEITRYL